MSQEIQASVFNQGKQIGSKCTGQFKFIFFLPKYQKDILHYIFHILICRYVILSKCKHLRIVQLIYFFKCILGINHI